MSDSREDFDEWYVAEFKRQPNPNGGYESGITWRAWQASRQAILDSSEAEYPSCDTCGESMDHVPWHYSTESDRHVHACDKCWPQVNPEIGQGDALNEHGKNRYGLDMAYFRNLINRELNQPLHNYRPSELARVLARAARTADADVLSESEFQCDAEPVAYIEGDEVYLKDDLAINQWIRINGQPLYTHPPSAGVPEGWKIERRTTDRIEICADGIGCFVARLNDNRIPAIMIYALANELLLNQLPQSKQQETDDD